MRKLDEARDSKYYRMHAIELEKALKSALRNHDSCCGAFHADAIADAILDKLNWDWDDDYDGIHSDWLEGEVEE